MGKRRIENIAISVAIIILSTSFAVHSLADRVVDANEPVVVTDHVFNTLTSVKSAVDRDAPSESAMSESAKRKKKPA